ncbi:MAG: S1 RNA-binding domain-containing protein [Lachnospiraceae bacterium]|nr:S1 RNA-binding domain-containing protein [Lachnospiraceae bacterium]
MAEQIETMEDLKTELEESLRKGPMDANYQELKDAMEKKEVFSVKILTSVKGGVTTEVNGIRAFIPLSQLSADYIENADSYINKTVEAVVISVDETKNSVIMSVREIEAEKKRQAKEAKLNSFKVGEDYEGVVDGLTDFGAFVDLGDGVKGLVHISRICNRRLKAPSDVLKVGDKVKVKLLEVKGNKLSLSMKEFDESAPEPRERKERPDRVERADREDHVEYTEEAISTSLAGLLSGIKVK